MDLKESLSFYRKEQGLSQVELAEALDVSRQTISKWETGAALPSAENLLALSRLYGVTVDALLCDSLEQSRTLFEGELSALLSDCSPRELKIITATLRTLKETLRRVDGEPS